MRRRDGVGVPVSIQTGFDMWKDFAFGVTKKDDYPVSGFDWEWDLCKEPLFRSIFITTNAIPKRVVSLLLFDLCHKFGVFLP